MAKLTVYGETKTYDVRLHENAERGVSICIFSLEGTLLGTVGYIKNNGEVCLFYDADMPKGFRRGRDT